MITKFNNYINENFKDLLKPKSKKDMKKHLDEITDNFRISKIFEMELLYDLLPRDKGGICTYGENLFLGSKDLKSLPENLTVNGNLNVSWNHLTELPKGLIVNGKLDCSGNKIEKIQSDLKVSGLLDLSNNNLTKLPDNLEVGGDLYCNNNLLIELPKRLKVGGDLYYDGNLEIPDDAEIRGEIFNEKPKIETMFSEEEVEAEEEEGEFDDFEYGEEGMATPPNNEDG